MFKEKVMRKQIGWYDLQTCDFFNGDKDDGCHGTYSEPVYVDDDPGLWHETQLQILENQCAFLVVALRNDDLDVELRKHLIGERQNSIKLLQKGKESL